MAAFTLTRIQCLYVPSIVGFLTRPSLRPGIASTTGPASSPKFIGSVRQRPALAAMIRATGGRCAQDIANRNVEWTKTPLPLRAGSAMAVGRPGVVDQNDPALTLCRRRSCLRPTCCQSTLTTKDERPAMYARHHWDTTERNEPLWIVS
jgi:hypothetical protein